MEQVPLQIAQLRASAILGNKSNAFDTIDSAVIYSNKMREVSGVILSVSLTLMKDQWNTLPLDKRSEWEYKFYAYAEARTGFKRPTVDNLINVGRTWLLSPPPVELPSKVELYDKYGKATGKKIKPDPFSLPVSKLLVSTAAAKDGRLGFDKVAMGQLFNRDVPVHTLNDTLQGRGPGMLAPVPKTYHKLEFYLSGPLLMASRGYHHTPIAEIDWDGQDKDPLAKEALDLLMSTLQVKGWNE